MPSNLCAVTSAPPRITAPPRPGAPAFAKRRDPVMSGWRDDPDTRAAIERGKEIMAAFTQGQAVTEAELALNGIFPVCVVHGHMESYEDEQLIGGTLPELAEQCAREAGPTWPAR